jgi:hypothetical protein
MIRDLSPADLQRLVADAYADIDPEAVALLAGLTQARRFAMVCELADFARECYVLQERARSPEATETEIQACVRQRMWNRVAE